MYNVEVRGLPLAGGPVERMVGRLVNEDTKG